MSSINRFKKPLALVLTCALSSTFFTGCNKQTEDTAATKQYLIDIDYSKLEKEDQKTNYQTLTLKTEEYQLTYSDFASPVYNAQDILLDAPYGDKEFIRYTVKSGDYVKEGDPIMIYRVTFDEVDIAQTNLTLTRKKEELEKFIESETKRLAEYLEYIATIPNTTKQFADACEDYFKQEKVYKEQLEEKQEEIDKLTEKTEWFLLNGSEVSVNAPMDGCVEVENRIWWLGHETKIASIYDPHTCFYHISNQFGYYSYGQPVEAVYTDANKQEKTLTGVVISTSSIAPNGAMEDGAILKMDIPEDMTVSPTKIKASIQTTKIKDAILIPKSAVVQKNKMYYIDYLTSTGVLRRYIDVVTATKQEYVVLDPTLIGLQVILN